MVLAFIAAALANAGREPCEYPTERLSDWALPSDHALFMVVPWRHRDDLSATSDGIDLPVTTWCDDRCLVVVDTVGLPPGATVQLTSPALDDDDVADAVHVTALPTGGFGMTFDVVAPAGLAPSLKAPSWERAGLRVDETVCRGDSIHVLDVDTHVPGDVLGLIVRTSIEGGSGHYLSFQHAPYDVDVTLGLEGDPGTCHRAQVITWDGRLGDLSAPVCDGAEPLWTCATAGSPSGTTGVLALLLGLARRRAPRSGRRGQGVHTRST